MSVKHVQLQAQFSRGQDPSYLYSKYYRAMRFFHNLIFAILARMLCGNTLKFET